MHRVSRIRSVFHQDYRYDRIGTLALIGGDVLINGGRLSATGGRIELGSVTGVGNVSLTQIENRFVLGYEAIQDFGTVSLSNAAFVDVGGKRGGDLRIRGARLELAQGSLIRADISGAQNGGQVLIEATEIDLSEGSLLYDGVAPTGTGKGGDLTINTSRLFVRDGSQIAAGTFGQGKGGNLQITASDVIDVSGRSADGRVASGLAVQTQGSGDAGNLRIDTKRLLVRDGAGISAGTRRGGKGGNIQITASDAVEVVGASADGQFESSLVVQGARGTSGDAGSLRIDTQTLVGARWGTGISRNFR